MIKHARIKTNTKTISRHSGTASAFLLLFHSPSNTGTTLIFATIHIFTFIPELSNPKARGLNLRYYPPQLLGKNLASFQPSIQQLEIFALMIAIRK